MDLLWSVISMDLLLVKVQAYSFTQMILLLHDIIISLFFDGLS